MSDSFWFPTHFRGCVKANGPVIIHHNWWIMSKELAGSVWEIHDRSKRPTTLSWTIKPQWIEFDTFRIFSRRLPWPLGMCVLQVLCVRQEPSFLSSTLALQELGVLSWGLKTSLPAGPALQDSTATAPESASPPAFVIPVWGLIIEKLLFISTLRDRSSTCLLACFCVSTVF